MDLHKSLGLSSFMCSRKKTISSHQMPLFTKQKIITQRLAVDPDLHYQPSSLKKSSSTMKNISRIRILYSFCVLALVRAKHVGKPSNPIFGITSHLLMQSGGAQVATRERMNILKPRYASPPTSTDERTERSKVILSETEISGEDRDICIPNHHKEGGDDHGENECIRTGSDLHQESRTLDYDIQFETSYETSETVATATISQNIPSKKPTTLVSKIISTYLHFLANHALLTKSLTSGLIGGLGDICAQCFEQRGLAGASLFKMAVPLDRLRLFGIFFESIFLSGPIMHYAYDYMEYLVPVHGKGGQKSDSSLQQWFAASFHVLLDIVVLGPLFVLLLMATTSVIEGKVGSLKRELMTEFGPTLWVSTLASIGFIPTQLLAFRLLPVQFRLLYMNMQDIVWNAIVSFMAHKAR